MSPGPDAGASAPDGVVVRRWVKYGHDRLYVQAADGTRLGYWDDKKQVAVVQVEAQRELFEAALAGHRLRAEASGPCEQAAASHAKDPEEAKPPRPAEPVVVAVAPPPVRDPDPKPMWVDLAATEAGRLHVGRRSRSSRPHPSRRSWPVRCA